MNMICTRCGASYRLPPSAAKKSHFCSRHCKHAAARNKPVILTCVACGREFHSADKTTKTCSRFCHSQRGGTAPSKRTCACGKPASKYGYCLECAREAKKQRKREYYQRYADRVKAHVKNYNASLSLEERKLRKKKRQEERFNRRWAARLALDNFTCQQCGATDDLVVHHKHRHSDEILPSRKDDKSTIDDLLTLCRSCHMKAHHALGHINPERAVSVL